MPRVPRYFPHFSPTSREVAEFARDAAASAAPRPARWDDPSSCSTAAGTTSPLPRTPPAETATAAAGSSSPIAPDWSARSGWPSTPESESGTESESGESESGTGPRKRDRSDIVKLGGPAEVRAIFTRARHFDFGPPFAGDPWADRPTLGPNVSRFPSALPAGQRAGLVARSGEALPVTARRRFD